MARIADGRRSSAPTNLLRRMGALSLALGLCGLAPSPAAAQTTTAPQTALGGANQTYRSGVAKFTFSSTTTGATFECRLDGGAWEPCVSPRTVHVANGSHRFEAR